MKRKILFLLSSILLTAPAMVFGQNKANPVSYHNVQWSGQIAQFEFVDLDQRKLVRDKQASFFAEELVQLQFRVRIRPNGTVSYVASPRKNAENAEFCKGGASALYEFRFNPVAEKIGDQWVSVTMTVGD